MTPDLADKLIANSVVDPGTGCRRWVRSHNSRGYGLICVGGGKVDTVHRVAYRLWVGEIPEGYTIDHVHDRGCRHKDCFEPTHLEAVTGQENARRAAVLITRCPHGHEYTEDNTIVKTRASGRQERSCRTCQNTNRRIKRLIA